MSKAASTLHSWDELDSYRGELFTGEWPSIPDMVEITARKFPDRPCFTAFTPDRTTDTYAEVVQEAGKISMKLRDLGLEQGDRIGVIGENSPEWALAYLSILFTGCVVVPIDQQMQCRQTAELLLFAECKAVFTDSEKFDELSILLDKKKNSKSSIEHIFSLDPGKPDFIRAIKSRKKYRKPEIGEDDLAAILFTSGTTGNEKGVMLTHKNFVSDIYQACDPAFLTASEQDVFYALLPLHHSYAMTAVFLESLKHGSELVFGKAFVVKKIIADMQQSGVTVFMGIPLIFNKFLAGVLKKVREKGVGTYLMVRTLMWINGFLKKNFGINPGGRKWFKPILEGLGFSSINFCISGGGPLPERTFRGFQQLGLDFIQGYGLTETAPIVTLNPIHHFKLASVGKVFPFVDIKIDNPDSSGVGEILIKGPNVTQGYYKDPENTAALFNDKGYLISGDLGFLDSENYLYLRGRKKNLIVTEGGKNVFPEEIEAAFQLCTPIEQIMVRGYMMNKSKLSEGIEALIFPNREFFGENGDNPAVIEKEIQKAVTEMNQHFPPYKKISKVTILEEPMAMTSTKKIKRNRVEVRIA